MNPWMWLLFAVVAVIVLFIVTVIIAGIVQGMRTGPKCPRCGHDVSEPWPPKH